MSELHLNRSLSPKAKQWLERLAKKESRHDLLLIEHTCLFASQHEESNTPYSLSTLTQGLAMADVMVALHADSYAVAAAIAYPAIFFDASLKEVMLLHLDKTLCKIITGALQMDAVHQVQLSKIDKERIATGQQNQIDNLRKMMLAMVDDIRTILLKLAERLIMLQHLGRSTPALQKEIAQITMDYYAPLANRLGIGYLKWQLEDWSFRYLNYDAYQSIAKALNMRQKDRENNIQLMMQELKTLLENNGLKQATVSGRAKHLYSIFRKIERKQVEFENIYDASAVRILVPTVTDCYTALSLVHDHWTPITSEFDDYIAKPKSNGYQSIHTAVMQDDKTPIEIQIRTFEMHHNSELGVAAHWKYKENKSVHDTEEQKINLLRKLLDWQKQSLHNDASHTELYTQAFHDRVYVFSRTNDVFDLQKGATPLDFAYLVHTNIGHRCRGAKVNTVLVPLTYPLQTGDRIEILTSKEIHPSQDWMRAELGYLKTPHAIQKVKLWFRKLHHEKNLAAGSLIWEKLCRQHDFKKTDIEKIFTDFNLKSADSLLVSLGSGSIAQNALVQKLTAHNKSDESEKLDNTNTFIEEKKEHKPPTTAFSVSGAKCLLTQLAKCCHPIPGDAIIGYITVGRGISVHQQKCKNIQEALLSRPEKLIDISWDEQTEKNYRVSLEIDGEDRPGLLRDISGLIAQLNLSINAMSSHVNTQNYIAIIHITIEVKNLNLLEEILRKIKQVPGVIKVQRK